MNYNITGVDCFPRMKPMKTESVDICISMASIPFIAKIQTIVSGINVIHMKRMGGRSKLRYCRLSQLVR